MMNGREKEKGRVSEGPSPMTLWGKSSSRRGGEGKAPSWTSPGCSDLHAKKGSGSARASQSGRIWA